jgi:hypothetical protein
MACDHENTEIENLLGGPKLFCRDCGADLGKLKPDQVDCDHVWAQRNPMGPDRAPQPPGSCLKCGFQPVR